MKVFGSITFEYEIPDDPEARRAAYGETDEALCLSIDRDALMDDPGALVDALGGGDYQVVLAKR